MTADRIADAIHRTSQRQKARWPFLDQQHSTGMTGDARPAPVAPEEMDDEARWLEGQVQGWAAARSV